MAGFADNAKKYFLLYIVPLSTICFGYAMSLFYVTCQALVIGFRLAMNPYNAFKLFKVAKRPVPPSILNEYGTHQYIQLKNVKLHYVEAGDKEKPLMIMIHGYPEFWYGWRHQIKEFSNDYWTVAVDMRGYGDSEKPSGTRYYRIKYLVEDIKNLIEGLGRQKCTLMAHDWGGAVLLAFIQQYPEYAEKCILINSPDIRSFFKRTVENFAQFKKSWYVYANLMPMIPEIGMRFNDMEIFDYVFERKTNPLTEEELEAYKFTFGKPGAFTCPINYYRANFSFNRRELKKNKLPSDCPETLLIYGGKDKFLSSSLFEKMDRDLPYVTAKKINDGGHYAHQEEPEKVNAMIREFLSSKK